MQFSRSGGSARLDARSASEGAAEPALPAKLSEFSFQDIYIAPDCPSLARGLRPRPTGSDGQALSEVPELAGEDARALLAATEAESVRNEGRGEFAFRFDGVRYRAARIGTPELRRWCLRRLPSIVPELTNLGLPGWLATELKGYGASHGLVLVAGHFSSGKTTTASSVLRAWLDAFGDIAVTVEDPPEADLEGPAARGGMCYQIPVLGDDWATAIKASRRWAPRYFLLGEVRTPTAAAELLHVSLGGPMVLTTIHADGVVSALLSTMRFAAAEVGEDMARLILGNSLKGVLYQELNDGKLAADYLSLSGDQEPVLRQKIRSGALNHIQAEIEVQRARRRQGLKA
jgi:Tfp pilus assembly pilus retraction ATPase PilT